MDPQNRNLIDRAVGMFTETTGIKAGVMNIKEKNMHSDSMIRIGDQGECREFAVKVRGRLTRSTAAMEKARPAQKCILITEYVTPPLADLMKSLGLFFMDTAGNAYIDSPPLHIFVKGIRRPENLKPVPVRRLFKPAGLKVVFALLNNPEMFSLPYREIADAAGVALGTVNWIFRDLKETGFLLETDRRRRKAVNSMTLLKRWAEAYPEQLRPGLGIERFSAEAPDWWKEVDITDHNACWGGEVAAARLTGYLKPEKVVIYAAEPPVGLIIRNRLRKMPAGDIEILKPFWNFDYELAPSGIVPPLIVYSELMLTGDIRNIETAKIIYDRYLL